MKKIIELFGLGIGLSAVIVLTYFLIVNTGICLKLFEPNQLIRSIEILMGIITIFILIFSIGNKIKK